MLTFPLSIENKEFIKSKTYQERILTQLRIYFLTEKGTRIMRPLLGTSLRGKLGEFNIRELVEDVKRELEIELESLIRNIDIDNIEVLENDLNQFSLEIDYKIVDRGVTISDSEKFRIQIK